MSGGSFDYAYSRVNIFADELGNKIDNTDILNEWGEKPNSFSPEVVAKLREIQTITVRTAKLMREVEWFYSSDTGEDTFLSRVSEIEAGK